MKTLHKKRLLKLAKHLRSGKLGHKKFDFNYINAEFVEPGYAEEKDSNGCGTLGCAIGEMPFVFPRTVGFIKGQPLPIDRGWRKRCNRLYNPSFKMAEDFFGIGYAESSHLFIPGRQDTSEFGGRSLDKFAKPSSVAANIEAFVKRKEKEAA